jgi:hypothetical protein
MSAPIGNDQDSQGPETPTMYAPPWARDGGRDAPGDAGIAAVDKALKASNEFRRTLPPAAPLEAVEKNSRWRDKPFDGDVAARHLRERPSLDPVSVPTPPMREPGTTAGVVARVAGAVGLAALAAFFMVGTAPLSLAVKAEGDGAPPSFWSRFVAPSGARQVPTQEFKLASAESDAPVGLADRFAAAMPMPEAALRAQPVEAPPVRTAALAPAPAPAEVAPMPAPPPVPSLRALDREEIALLVKRSEDLIVQGDIAAARLMLTRAAEAGDARAALALGSTYDSGVLRKLGVLGVAADPARAREWYAKAVEFGSPEATRRLEQLAQSVR